MSQKLQFVSHELSSVHLARSVHCWSKTDMILLNTFCSSEIIISRVINRSKCISACTLYIIMLLQKASTREFFFNIKKLSSNESDELHIGANF